MNIIWHRLIHVADPTYCWWDKNRLFLVVVSFNRILNIVNLGVCVTHPLLKLKMKRRLQISMYLCLILILTIICKELKK